MTKQELIDRVAAKTQLSKRDAGKAIDAFLEAVTESLKKGEDVTFKGVGRIRIEKDNR
jgi:DNA-binding protein HU-beta